jgi:hypothetical protein
MASLENIENLVTELERRGISTDPHWVQGYEKRDNHLSGALREAAMNWSDLPAEVEMLLDEAAEVLDDAHEDWLSNRVAMARLLI